MNRSLGSWLWALLLTLSVAGDALLGPRRELPMPPASLPSPSPSLAAQPESNGAANLLVLRRLTVPVRGVRRSQLQDTFAAARSRGRNHQAIDIMAPWGTPVLAADDGRLEKISHNAAGGLAAYQSDPSGQFVYYYAHLAGYAQGLREGQPLRRGDVIGYVGATGNAPKHAPHLHFAVMQLTHKGRWWGGEALNPYAALVQGDTVVAKQP
jgi:murein DD-endopeptidase MepM/ murein hydrolase activator NlpD